MFHYRPCDVCVAGVHWTELCREFTERLGGGTGGSLEASGSAFARPDGGQKSLHVSLCRRRQGKHMKDQY